MYPKEYYQACLKVISHVIEDGNTSVTLEKGMELAGDYWPRIYGELREMKACSGVNTWGLLVTNPKLLLPLRADCRFTIAMIERTEADRNLDMESKVSAMQEAKFARWLSIVAILISLATFINQVVSF